MALSLSPKVISPEVTKLVPVIVVPVIAAAVVAPIIVPSMLPPLMSAVVIVPVVILAVPRVVVPVTPSVPVMLAFSSTSRVSIWAVPSRKRSLYSKEVVPRSTVLSVLGRSTEAVATTS